MSQSQTPQNPLGKKFYFSQLDGLRFFAFIIVFLHHTLLNISSDNPLLNTFLVIIQKNGWIGVDLFFVLSGFLITILLLKEREQFGKYSVKNFWIRRGLRIWPLYYLGVFFGFFIFPLLDTQLTGISYSDSKYTQQINNQLYLYLTFLGNWAVSLMGYGSFTNISHLWTISLEEQFYLIWPVILLLITSWKKTLLYSGLIIIVALLTRLFLASIGTPHPGIYTNTFARLDTLTLGATVALTLFYKPEIFQKFKFIFSLPVLCLVSSSFIYLLYQYYFLNPYPVVISVFGYFIIALFMGYYLLSALLGNRYLQSILSFKPFVWMGKISYGLYVWHVATIQLIKPFLDESILIFIITSFTVTLVLGALSYYLYEIYFLRLKSKFTRIQSRSV